MTTVADRLKIAREAAGYKSAGAAAERFGWVESTVYAHENGQNGLTAKRAQIYASAYKCSQGWLLTGDGDSPIEEQNPLSVDAELDKIGATHALRAGVYGVAMAFIKAWPGLGEERRES